MSTNTFSSAGGSGFSSNADNAVIYQNNNILGSSKVYILNRSAAAGVCDVYVSLDGSNYSTLASQVFIPNAAGVTNNAGRTVDIEIAQTELGCLAGSYRGVKILQKGATACSAVDVLIV